MVENYTRLSRLKERFYASLCCLRGTREKRIPQELSKNKQLHQDTGIDASAQCNPACTGILRT